MGCVWEAVPLVSKGSLNPAVSCNVCGAAGTGQEGLRQCSSLTVTVLPCLAIFLRGIGHLADSSAAAGAVLNSQRA